MKEAKIENGLPSKIIPNCTGDEKIKRTKSKRCRRRVSQLLHTHVALIAVCVLSALDAACVLGQIICDILIMTEKIHHSELLEAEATEVFIGACPVLNGTDTSKSLQSVVDILKELEDCNSPPPDPHGDHNHDNPYKPQRRGAMGDIAMHRSASEFYDRYLRRKILNIQSADPGTPLIKATADGGHDDHHEHTLLEELTHVFHLGSMVILSILVVETFTKMFAMGEKFLHHRLEVFDAFVVTVSWCLDIAFYDGIWAKPGTEAATILIFILPWRVIRIVNSFVLVIQEKDLVQLKIVKQQYRRTVKKANELKNKTDGYRSEIRHLQGLSRKYGANEPEIMACAPLGKRRRISSVISAMNSFASLAMIGAVSSVPDLARESSDEEDDIEMNSKDLEEKANHILRSVSIDSGLSTSPVTFSLSPDPMDNTTLQNDVFTFDNTPDSIRTENLRKGLYTKM